MQVNPNIASWFRAVDQDNSGQITASELKRALVNGNWSNFSEEACKLMIGKLTNENYHNLQGFDDHQEQCFHREKILKTLKDVSILCLKPFNFFSRVEESFKVSYS
jgi:hypothetical protein